MALSSLQKLLIYKTRYSDLYNELQQRLKYIPSLDLDFIDDFDYMLSKIEKEEYNIKNEIKIRSKRLYILFSSTVRDESHFMSKISRDNISYMEKPIDENYGNSYFVSLFSNLSFFEEIEKYEVILSKSGSYSIVYIESDNHYLLEQIKNIHPYYAAHTIHELMRLILEWQWAYYYAGSSETMSIMSNEFLTDLGIDVRNSDGSIEKTLLNLPDMYISQYFKGIDFSSEDNDPLQTVDFKLWAINSGPFYFYDKQYAGLYENVLLLKKTKDKIKELESAL